MELYTCPHCSEYAATWMKFCTLWVLNPRKKCDNCQKEIKLNLVTCLLLNLITILIILPGLALLYLFSTFSSDAIPQVLGLLAFPFLCIFLLIVQLMITPWIVVQKFNKKIFLPRIKRKE
jgi:hypothetical protein